MFVADLRLGVTAWLAAAAHEVTQELGDFGVLVHGGFSRKRALPFNVVSALTFPLGMLGAWAASGAVDISLLIPFGAGNFLYIAAADLVPEVKGSETLKHALLHLLCFALGLLVLLALR